MWIFCLDDLSNAITCPDNLLSAISCLDKLSLLVSRPDKWSRSINKGEYSGRSRLPYKFLQWFWSCRLHEISMTMTLWPWPLNIRPWTCRHCHVDWDMWTCGQNYWVLPMSFLTMRPCIQKRKKTGSQPHAQTYVHSPDSLIAKCLFHPMAAKSIKLNLFALKSGQNFYHKNVCGMRQRM